jgi:hypothetical protein
MAGLAGAFLAVLRPRLSHREPTDSGGAYCGRCSLCSSAVVLAFAGTVRIEAFQPEYERLDAGRAHDPTP